MAGFHLKEGEYSNKMVSEEELWRAFYLVFSTKTVNSSSYKFVFLKSIIDKLDVVDENLQLSFDQVFERFTEIYWTLVVKYGICQGNSSKSETYLEQILHDYVGNYDGQASIKFDDLTDVAKANLVKKVKCKCKIYVVGALYSDTKSLFYSFSKKEEWIRLNPQMYQFLLNHKESIQELNYFELAKFVERVNAKSTTFGLREVIHADNQKDDLAVYRQLIFEEFEKSSNSAKEDLNINTLDILYAAEESYNQARDVEKENKRIVTLYEEKDFIDDDSESMMMYLGEPERIIKMLKLRKGICS